MNDTWIDKKEKTISDDIVAIAKEETGLTNFKSVGVLRAFIEVISRVVIFIYNTAINPIYRNASLDGAAGFFLSLWGLMLGVVRKAESKTTGNFTGTSYADGKITAGCWAVLEGTELRYKITEDVTFQTGATFNIPVIAEFSGSAYNIGSGMTIRLTRVISGLDTITIGDDWITAPGQDTENDDPYRERIKTRWRSQILGDTKETYKYYAEAVTGVRSAHVIRTPRGAGTTDVIIAAVNGIPSDELLEAVEAALYDHCLMAFDVQIKAPQIVPINIDIEYTGGADEADVRLAAESYVYNLGIGGRFAERDLYALYKPLELTSIEILSPARDVSVNEGSIITATITVARITA